MSAMNASDMHSVNSTRVSCDGGEEGHPRVFLHIDHETNEAVCPYCSRRFVLKTGRDFHVHH